MTGDIQRLASALLLCGVWVVAAQDYEIKFERPLTAGDKYHISSFRSLKQTRVTKVNGQVKDEQSTRSEALLEADVVALVVNDKGETDKLEYTVRQFTRSDGGKPTEALAEGKVIIVDRTVKDASPFSLKDGGTLEPAVLQALQLVIAGNTKNAADGDLVFGTRERKTVGAEWPVNADEVVAGLAKSGLAAKKETVSGTVRLESLERVNDIDCLRFTMSTAAELSVPRQPEIKGGAFETTLVKIFPVDTTKPMQSFSAQMHALSITQTGQDSVVEEHTNVVGSWKRVFNK